MAALAERTPTPGRPCRVLVWYWGRTGAGPLYALELLRSFMQQPDLSVSGSIAAGNALRTETTALGLPLEIVDTYHDKASFARATLRLPLIRARFARYLRQQRFDIVLSTMNHLWTPLLADCVTRSGARYIPVFHDATPHPGEAQPFWRWRRQQEIRQARHIMTLSTAVADGVAAAYAYPRGKISVIPYGIPAMPSARQETRTFPAERPFRFMFFGRIMAYKGLERLLAAYRLLRQNQPQAELWLVGAGDCSPYQAALADLPGLTIVNRWIEEPEIPGFLNQADAIVLPYSEASQSGVTSQAYAAGLPVVVTPVGGLTEQLIPDVTGVLAADTSPAAFAAAMQRLLAPNFYAQLANQVQHYRQAWSFMAQGRVYADLFQRVWAEPA